MEKRDVGNLIKTLRAGKSVACPECEKGMVVPKKESDNYFRCDSCDFTVHLNKI